MLSAALVRSTRSTSGAARSHAAYSSSALDHTTDPPRILDALSCVLRPGGLLGLEVFTREGSREQWWPLFPADSPFDVVDIPIQHDTVTAVVARRKMQ